MNNYIRIIIVILYYYNYIFKLKCYHKSSSEYVKKKKKIPQKWPKTKSSEFSVAEASAQAPRVHN